jgi:transcriptional regulator with XRE-family HTH domain
VAPVPPPEGYPRELRHLGDRLKKRRLDLGLRQQDVAGQLGVNRRTYENWEAGKHEPEVRYWPGVVSVLGYDPSPEVTCLSLGERIKAARRRDGLSQRQLAERLKLDPTTVQAWESGQVRRRYPRLLRLFEEYVKDCRG